MSALVVRLPYESPPIRSNDRLHWRAKARVVKAVRATGAWAGANVIRDNVIEDGFPIAHPVVVTLVWEVCDRRVRDAGSIAPTGKAVIDGLVDAGVLSSDRSEVVTEERYRVEVGPSRGVRLEIEAA
jgi:crossover junction endodeoxyribonuclease RusA